jgi:hypothetical protein
MGIWSQWYFGIDFDHSDNIVAFRKNLKISNHFKGDCMKEQKSQMNYSEFPHVSHDHMQTLLKCYSICSACAKMCIKESHPITAILCSDCADICGLTIKLHNGDSEFNHEMMKLCAHACKRCAEECAKHSSKHCQQCSQICYECSQACKEGK